MQPMYLKHEGYDDEYNDNDDGLKIKLVIKNR